jgi:hypothetical protein
MVAALRRPSGGPEIGRAKTMTDNSALRRAAVVPPTGRDPFSTRSDRLIDRLPARVQVPVRRLRWMVAAASRATLARRERHWETSYREVNRFTNHLAARDGRQRDSYTWCTLHAARLARHLGQERISVVEFGVAGGKGLLALEQAARWAEQCFEVAVDVVGFDSGLGLGAPKDARDLPNIWSQGDFVMDEARLRAQLSRAQLILGWVADTLPAWLEQDPAPVGFCAFDVDQYQATVDALQILRAPLDNLLPRVHCLFDDVLGYTFGDNNGERLAIREYNERDPSRWISPVYGLQHFVPQRIRDASWVDKIFLAHLTDHPDYPRPDGLADVAELPLT